MIDIKSIITTIESLLAQGTPQSVTYAALECRLAIEKICYDRLKIAHDYISHNDLRRWQPRDVVDTLIAEVDGRIASTFTLSISSRPVDETSPPETAEDYEKIEWVEVGTQVGFDPKRLGNLWHSLSGLALHVRVPKSKEDIIPDYGDEQDIRKKVEETLVELRGLADGTLLSSGLGEEVSFTCECGRLNKRRAELLKDGQTVTCVGFDCPQSYRVSIDASDISFVPRNALIKCECGKEVRVPTRTLERLKSDQVLNIECECGVHTKVAWRLGQARSKT